MRKTAQNLSITLIKAVAYGNIDEVKTALEQGADVNARSAFGNTALHGINGKYGAEIAKLLINAGADVNARNFGGATPLHYVAVSNNTGETIQVLINAGADVNATNAFGVPPIDMALREAHSIAVITSLLAAGAEPRYKNRTSGLLHRNTHLSEKDKEELKARIKAYIKAKRDLRNFWKELQ